MSGLWMQGLAADLGAALLHSLWQIAVVAGALWATLTLLHRAQPRHRYLLAYGALVLAFAWPLRTFQLKRQERVARQAIVALAPRPARLTPIVMTPTPTSSPDLSRLLPWMGLLWGGGALLMGLRQAGGWWWLLRLRTRTAPVPAHLGERAARLARRLGMKPPELRLLAEASGPFCYGLFRTVVVLPAACLTAMDATTLEALLAHEFAHLRRRDFLFNGVQACLDVLLFHHPLARWISSQVRLERERACDESAAAACGDARTIARALLELEDLRPPLAALAAQGAPLTHRIHALLGRSPRPSPLATAAAALLLGGTAFALAAPTPHDTTKRVEAPASLVRMADDAARAEGLDPYLVRAVVQVESRYNPSAKSPMGAVGLMQLMPATAARLGADHPESPEENLRAGAKYLHELLDRYHGDLGKAVMAYNAGPEALDRSAGLAPTEESRLYTLAVLDLYQHKAVEAAPAGTFFGTLTPAGPDRYDLQLLGDVPQDLEVKGLQDAPSGPTQIFGMRMSTTPSDSGGKTGFASPRIRFQLEHPGAPLRIQLHATSGAQAEVILDPAQLPSTFNLRMIQP